jgi:hypothetical protein
MKNPEKAFATETPRHREGSILFLPALRLCASVAIFLLWLIGSADATPFYLQINRSDSPAVTNQIGVSYYPPNQQAPFTVYGTNIIYGGNILTITPNSSGYSSNWLYPGTYEFYFTNLNAAFVAVIPDTVSFQSLALYITNAPAFPGVGLNSYGMVTNLLGFPPATNTPAGIDAAQGFASATNSNPGITAAQGFASATNSNAGITAAQGFASATNSNAGITAAQGFASATNSNAGITAAQGFASATNSNAGITAAQGFASATNSNAGITAAQGFASATNSTAGIKAALLYTPQTNYVGQSGAVAFLSTNGFAIWVSYQTNGVPGTAFTNLPAGSLMTTTNGALFVLTNLVWIAK